MQAEVLGRSRAQGYLRLRQAVRTADAAYRAGQASAPFDRRTYESTFL